jgi:hypothetical protein
MTYAQIGSVSSGTLRSEDLIPAFCDCLDDLKQELALSVQPGDELETVQRCSQIDGLLSMIEQNQGDEGYYDSEEAQDDLGNLVEWLETFAPPYCYFGAHEGDGADFGFWPSMDSLNEDLQTGELLEVSDLSEVPDDFTGQIWHVNDHGNGALYLADNGKLSEIWSIV